MFACACSLLDRIVACPLAGFSHFHFIAIAVACSIVVMCCATNRKCIDFLNGHFGFVTGFTTFIIILGVCYSISYNGLDKFFNLSFSSILEIFTIVFLVMLLTHRREMKVHRIEMLSSTIDSVDKMFSDMNQEYERSRSDPKKLRLLLEQQKNIYISLGYLEIELKKDVAANCGSELKQLISVHSKMRLLLNLDAGASGRDLVNDMSILVASAHSIFTILKLKLYQQ